MLLKNCCHVVQSLKVNLYFDDDTEKHLIINEKDIVRVVYNNNGMKSTIQGKVTKIKSEDYHVDRKGASYIIIDGSDVYEGNCARIRFDHILDCDIIEKFDEQLFVKTVSDKTQSINKIKLVDDKLYVFREAFGEWVGGISIIPQVDETPEENNNSTSDTEEDSTDNSVVE